MFGVAGIALTAVLSVVAHVAIRQWYRPVVAFQAGDFYRTGATAITSVRLENYGNESASAIDIAVSFPSPIESIQSSHPAVKVETISGGPGDRRFVGRITRVAPGESLSIYFSVIDPGPGPLPAPYATFVTSVVHDSGRAIEGVPLRALVIRQFPSVAVSLISTFLLGYLVSKIYLRDLSRRMDATERRVDQHKFALDAIDSLVDAVESEDEAGRPIPEAVRTVLNRYREKAGALGDGDSER